MLSRDESGVKLGDNWILVVQHRLLHGSQLRLKLLGDPTEAMRDHRRFVLGPVEESTLYIEGAALAEARRQEHKTPSNTPLCPPLGLRARGGKARRRSSARTRYGAWAGTGGRIGETDTVGGEGSRKSSAWAGEAAWAGMGARVAAARARGGSG